MFEVMHQGGPFMYVIAICGILAAVQAIRKGIGLFAGGTSSEEELRRGLDSILHLGVFSLVVGLLSQAYGIVLALDEIRKAADVSPAMIMTGLQISFYAPIFGAAVCLICLAVWAVFRYRVESLLAAG